MLRSITELVSIDVCMTNAFAKSRILSKWRSTICGRPILTVATVPAQAAKVCELGAMHRAQTRNLDAPIRATKHAASATGTRP
jgi:hypothetical protein